MVKLGSAGRADRLRASGLVSMEPRSQAACLAPLKTMAEVERVVTTSGRFDLLLQITAADRQPLDQVLDDIGAIPSVQSSESLIHLSTKIDRAPNSQRPSPRRMISD